MMKRTMRFALGITVLVSLLVAVIGQAGVQAQAILTARSFLPLAWKVASHPPAGVPVDPGDPGVKGPRLSVLNNTSCLVTTTGQVKCWGEGFLNTAENAILLPFSNVAETVAGLSSISSVAVGEDFLCALTFTGGVKCLGRNNSGQLGNNSSTDSSAPVDVQGLTSGVTAIAAGSQHACALLSSGKMQCWGSDAAGQIGADPANSQPVRTPTDVTGMDSAVTAIATGESHSCAVKSGGLWCWGSNEFSQIGEELNMEEYLVPVQVFNLTSGIATVSAGGQTTCAGLAAGGLRCWGNNGNGQVGNGLEDGIFELPQTVTSFASAAVKDFSVGSATTCAVLPDGSARCWGSSTAGQAGNGAIVEQLLTPTAVGGIAGAAEIAPGQDHSCALLSGNTVKCWGFDFLGQLGDTKDGDSLTPVTVEGL